MIFASICQSTYLLIYLQFPFAGALTQVAKQDEFFEKLPELFSLSMDRITKELYVGDIAGKVKDLAITVKNSLTAYEDTHELFFKFLLDNLYPIISDVKGVFSSSLSSVFYVGVNKLLNDSNFVTTFSSLVLDLFESPSPTSDIVNVFVGACMLHLSTVTLIYMTRQIHGSTATDEIRRKRSLDKMVLFLSCSCVIILVVPWLKGICTRALNT